jgi:hypothetical protein
MVPDEAHFASAVDFKAPIRAEIERIGYTIIANMGEQPSDLLGGIGDRVKKSRGRYRENETLCRKFTSIMRRQRITTTKLPSIIATSCRSWHRRESHGVSPFR